MSPRSEEFMDLAVARVKTARAALALDSASAVSLAYYADINAARAALSERDAYARTHGGTWHLFREEFVTSGHFDPQLASAAAAVQKQREAADYEAVRPSEHEAAAAVQTAERFVAAIQAMLANP
ncbi:MAG: hypothetical protein H0U33_05740 [Solirubrobacterales bacterium]|nr:hypothetical protein [Solirubrobacterales bacterium]